MSTIDLKSSSYWLKKLSALVGGTIVAPVQTVPDENGDVYLGLEIKKGKTTVIMMILADEEGNGPGVFELNRKEDYDVRM